MEVDNAAIIEGETILGEESTKEKYKTTRDGWDILSELASSVTTQKIKGTKRGIVQFMDEMKTEANEIYNESLEGSFNDLVHSIPLLVSKTIGGTAKDKDFYATESSGNNQISNEFLKEAPEYELWKVFIKEDMMRDKFGEAQQKAILMNDKNLNKIFQEIISERMSNDEFWKRWRFWNYIKRHEEETAVTAALQNPKVTESEPMSSNGAVDININGVANINEATHPSDITSPILGEATDLNQTTNLDETTKLNETTNLEGSVNCKDDWENWD